jgi:beta-glucosidase
LSIEAGVDMDMQGAVFYNHLPALVKEGKVPEERVNEAVRKILETKYKLGLFEDPYRYSDEQREQQNVMTAAHREAAREVARKSIVLLKNDNQTLPLQKNISTLAVIGPLADNKQELIGSWSAAGDWQQAVSLLEGIKSKVGENVKVSYAKGCNINDDSAQYFQEAIRTARAADVVVLALGEAALMSGEAASRADISLPGVQLELAKELHQLEKPLVVVLMNGRPLTINWLDENVPAILETWFLGTEAGNAIADVLFGDYNPSGKLPITFPRSVGQIPLYYNHKNTGRPLSENKYTSKYLDIPNTPLYPFGFGLSYTTFEYADLQLDTPEITVNDTLMVSVKVTNTGQHAGEEVVQLYIQDLVGSVTRPVKELKGFQKIALEPGQAQTITFPISKADLSFYRSDMTFGTEPGTFKIFVGTNSDETLSAEFVLNE